MKIKRFIALVFAVLLTGFGAALNLKAAIGVGAWDALSQTASLMTGIKVGTVAMFFNLLCVLVQLVILKKKFGIAQLLQIPLCILAGMSVNLFYYDVFSGLHLAGSAIPELEWSYVVRILMLIVGYLCTAMAASLVLLFNVVTYSLESACKVVSDRFGTSITVLRTGIDVGGILVCIIASALTHVPLAVREGTVLGMFLFGPLMGFFMKTMRPILKKYDLAD